MSIINIIATIVPAKEDLVESQIAFGKLAVAVRENEKECLTFWGFNSSDGKIVIHKQYPSMEAWKTHRAAPWTQEALAICKVEPEIHVYEGVSGFGFGAPVQNGAEVEAFNVPLPACVEDIITAAA